MDQAGMKAQLCQLYTLLNVTDPQLAQYLNKNESGNMFFCFRWLLVLFKREFSAVDIMKLWEILWTDLPCKNFHLLFCAAILDTEKSMLMENRYGFTEILKVIWFQNCEHPIVSNLLQLFIYSVNNLMLVIFKNIPQY